ncbi:hypothetical protein DFH09DRAFT_1069334 [Mycena vulgaris]|nr:hypothetical protein DFH09DRAFT_1069334 [Mycena vulgaris]
MKQGPHKQPRFTLLAEVGIKCVAYASSVNTIGLMYSEQKLKLPYFPIDEDYPCHPSDSYALAKLEAETAANLSQLVSRHENRVQEVRKEHKENWDEAAVKQLWGWVNPVVTARVCLMGVTNSDRWEGCEIFNIIAPDTVTNRTHRTTFWGSVKSLKFIRIFIIVHPEFKIQARRVEFLARSKAQGPIE